MKVSKTKLGSLACTLALVAAAAGCGSDDDGTIASWGGSEHHFEMAGTLDGESLDFAVTGAEATAASLSCIREYEVPLVDGVPDYSQAQFVEVKLNIIVDTNGQERLLELEFKRHDMSADAIGATVKVVPRVEGVDPASDEMWFEWEWHTLTDQDLFESAARQGTFDVEHFTGTADADGIIPDNTGEIGGLLNANWSVDESMTVSFTAPCGENKISEVL